MTDNTKSTLRLIAVVAVVTLFWLWVAYLCGWDLPEWTQ